MKRTDPFPHERLAVDVALALLQRGEPIPENTAYVCVVAAHRLMRDMTTDPCTHACQTGVGPMLYRCDECGEWSNQPSRSTAR